MGSFKVTLQKKNKLIYVHAIASDKTEAIKNLMQVYNIETNEFKYIVKSPMYLKEWNNN